LSFWVETAWGARRSARVVFLTGWAFDFTSAVIPPFDVDAVSGTFSEVGSHGVTHGPSGHIFVFGEANVFFASFEVWGWVDDIFAFGVHDVGTKHDSLSRFSHTFGSSHVTESLFRSFQAFIASFPGVGKKSDGFDSGSISSSKIVNLVVVENAAQTTSLAHQSFVDFNKNRFIAVPFQSPRVSDFFNNQVVGDSGNVHTEKVGWDGDEVSFKSGNNWLTVFVFRQGNPGISNINVDSSAAFGFTFASRIVDNFDTERSGQNVFHQSITTVSLESENFAVKSSVMMLSPSHTITSFLWADLTFVHNTQNFSELVFVNDFSFLDTFWEVWVWVPFSFGARVESGHWNSGSEFVAFFASWETSKLTVVVFATDFTVDWSIQMLAFMGVRDTRWEPVTASW
jgi:hypothetical protein